MMSSVAGSSSVVKVRACRPMSSTMSAVSAKCQPVNGYNVRRPSEVDAFRSVNVARLTYDMDLSEAFSLTPFVEADASCYSHDARGKSDSHGWCGMRSSHQKRNSSGCTHLRMSR